MKNKLLIVAAVSGTLLLNSQLAHSAQPSSNELSPTQLQSEFEKALSLRESGNLFAAIDALNDILVIKPSLHRARIELAVAYYRAAEFNKAVNLANEVISQPNTSPKVVEVVKLFLDQVEEFKAAEALKRSSWSGSIGLAAGRDDNVNIGPNDDEFNVRGTILRLADDSQPKADNLITFTGNLNHTYRIPGSFRFGDRPVTALWQSTVGFTHRDYNNEDDRNLDLLSGSTGISVLSQKNWRANLNLQLDKLQLGGDSLALFSSINPSWTYSKPTGGEYTLRGQFMYRDFNRTIDESKNGYRVGAGADYSYRFDNNLLLQTGITLSKQDAREQTQQNKSIDGYVSLLAPAWTNGSVFGRVNFLTTRYNGKVAVFDKARRDREQRFVVGALHNINNSWQIRADYTYTDNNSSVKNFEFDRNEFSINLIKRF